MPWILDIAFDPSSTAGSQLAVSAAPAVRTQSGELQIWNVPVEKVERLLPVEPVPTRFNSIKFNHNGSLLIGGGSDGMIRVYDASRSGAIMGWPAFPNNLGVASICFSASETSIFSLSSDGRSVTEWSIHRVGEALRKFTMPENSPKTAFPFSNQNIAVSASKMAVVYGGMAHVLSLDSAEACPAVVTIPGVSAVDWDENTLVCGGMDGVVGSYLF
jgi:WD40 repeat protein